MARRRTVTFLLTAATALTVGACAQAPTRPQDTPIQTPTAGPRTADAQPATDADRLRLAQVHSTHRITAATFSVLAAQAGVDRLTRAIRELDADVVGLQAVEVGTPRVGGLDLPAHLAKTLGYYAAYSPAAESAPMDGGDEGSRPAAGSRGVALLSRTPLTRIQRSPLPTPPGTEPRAFLAAHTEIRGFRWTVGVSALSDPPENDDTPDPRRAQSRVIAEALGGREGCLLLVDLGAPADGEVFIPLSLVGDFAGLEGEPTFPARDPAVRRDHILISSDLWAPAVRVVDTGVSDHRAVVARVATRR